ncbi:MAG: FHA domain-containing protein [Sandaracinus sp.]|nr:FHA domain-containing protein [Sandaracinus sp.]
MFAVVITEKGGAQRRMEFDKNEVTIGRVQGNDIILPKGNVSKRHSRIVLKDNRFIVVDLKSTNGTYVNGRKITSPLVVKPGDKVYIGDFIITVEGLDGAGASVPPAGPPAAMGAGGPPRCRSPRVGRLRCRRRSRWVGRLRCRPRSRSRRSPRRNRSRLPRPRRHPRRCRRRSRWRRPHRSRRPP